MGGDLYVLRGISLEIPVRLTPNVSVVARVLFVEALTNWINLTGKPDLFAIMPGDHSTNTMTEVVRFEWYPNGDQIGFIHLPNGICRQTHVHMPRVIIGQSLRLHTSRTAHHVRRCEEVHQSKQPVRRHCPNRHSSCSSLYLARHISALSVEEREGHYCICPLCQTPTHSVPTSICTFRYGVRTNFTR